MRAPSQAGHPRDTLIRLLGRVTTEIAFTVYKETMLPTCQVHAHSCTSVLICTTDNVTKLNLYYLITVQQRPGRVVLNHKYKGEKMKMCRCSS